MTPAIAVEAVTCRFGPVVALDALSLAVPTGTVVGIVGPNGAGKTTLIDLVTGMVRPSEGRIRVLGHDVVADPGAIRARIGVVSQETALYDELTPLQNLEFSAALYGVKSASKRVQAVLDLVGLSARARDRAGALSGGMQRRLTIARALLHDPELLVLDEPTLGVDVEARHQIWNHVRSLRTEGRTVLLATNYLDEAEALCDTVAVLRAGKIIAQDAPSALVARAGRCLELECPEARIDEVRSAVAAHPRALGTESSRDRVTVYFDGSETPEDLVRAAMDVAPLRGFRVRSPDLMEVLRKLGDEAPSR